MKTRYRLIVPALLAATALTAQSPFGRLTSRTAPDPATMIANQVDRLTKLLTLTTAQQTQATTIFTNSLNAVTPLETVLSTNHTALAAAVKSNATGTIDSLAASIGTTSGQILAIREKADAAFYAILTAEQKAILDARGGPGGGRGPGGPGGPDGPGGPGGRGPRP